MSLKNLILNKLYNKPDLKKIPIIINNYNRLSHLKKLIEGLKSKGYHNIHVLDNLSTYPPLLEYYKENPDNLKLHLFKKNYGYKSLWKSGLWYKFMFNYFCYTDSDLEIMDECPDNFLTYFHNLLIKYPSTHKVGFSLNITDLPDHYSKKEEVIKWEEKFNLTEKENNVFIAPIDTTFALYRPFSRRGQRDGSQEMLRTGFPYQCRHLPWYNDCKNLSEEELYYINSVKKPTHWSKTS